MIFKLPSSSYEILSTKWGVGLYTVNGLIAIALLGTLLYFEVTAMNVLTLSIIVGFGSTMLMKSRLFSTKTVETNLTIGLDFIQQTMEKFFKHRMEEESSLTNARLYIRLEKYNPRELKKFAMAILLSKIKDSEERKKKVQHVEKIMNDSSTESEKSQSLSAIIVGDGGYYYATKVIKGKV
jgi:hypothetical protein